MKIIIGSAMIVMFLGAAPLLASSLGGGEYDKGKILYENKCLFCHGSKGNGNGPAAASLNPHPTNFGNPKFWQVNDEKKISDTIRNGRGEVMPAFNMESDKIQAIITYMTKTFKK